jgi:hypothetical protein
VKTGAYFADIGNYSTVAAASLNNHKKLPGKFRGEKSSDWIVTTKYYPLSDFHEISWSAWSRATNRLLFALTHKMRALRPSELARIAHRIGLGFRVWRIELDAAKRYVFTAVDDESHYSFIKGVDFMVEFHRPLAPRLDDRRV